MSREKTGQKRRLHALWKAAAKALDNLLKAGERESVRRLCVQYVAHSRRGVPLALPAGRSDARGICALAGAGLARSLERAACGFMVAVLDGIEDREDLTEQGQRLREALMVVYMPSDTAGADIEEARRTALEILEGGQTLGPLFENG